MAFPKLVSPDGQRTVTPTDPAQEVRLRYDGWYVEKEKVAAEKVVEQSAAADQAGDLKPEDTEGGPAAPAKPVSRSK